MSTEGASSTHEASDDEPVWQIRRHADPARVETSVGVVEVRARGLLIDVRAARGGVFRLARLHPTEVIVERPDGDRERAAVPDVVRTVERRLLLAGGLVALLAMLIERKVRR